MITKWRLITKASIRDGDCGRAADLFQGEEVVLDVYSTGTAFTEWEEIREREEIRDNDGKVTGVSFLSDSCFCRTNFFFFLALFVFMLIRICKLLLVFVHFRFL